jgi:hypothetical protein
MNTWGLGLVIGALTATALAFVWVAVKLGSTTGSSKKATKNGAEAYTDAAEADVEHILKNSAKNYVIAAVCILKKLSVKMLCSCSRIYGLLPHKSMSI